MTILYVPYTWLDLEVDDGGRVLADREIEAVELVELRLHEGLWFSVRERARTREREGSLYVPCLLDRRWTTGFVIQGSSERAIEREREILSCMCHVCSTGDGMWGLWRVWGG